jgi:hypothetical protein
MEGPMAMAAEQHTPAEWKLDVLLRYLVQRFRWRENFVLYAIDQRIANGDLPLKVRHYDLDKKFQGENVVDPGYYRSYLGLEIRDGRVHVTSKYFALVPGEFRYTVLEQDVQSVNWLAQSSQNAIDAATPAIETIERRDNEPGSTGPTVANLTTEPVTTKAWATAEVIKMKRNKEVPDDIGRNALAKELERRNHTAAEKNKLLRRVGWEHLANELSPWGLWPLTVVKI